MLRLLRRGLILVAATALAVTNSPADDEPPKLPPELEAVYGLALAAPPEFAANALLRVADRVQDRALRAGFIDMAFSLAAAAHHPQRLEAPPGSEPDSAAAALSSALKLGLDGLSLQSRAIVEMLPLRRLRARQMFEAMRRPTLEHASCQTELLPDPTAYFQAVAAIAQSGFDEEERARLDDLSFVVSTLSQISFVRELAPAAAFAASLNLEANRFELVAGALAARFEEVEADSRSYRASASAIDAAVAAVVAKAKSLGVSPAPFAAAYRSFLVKQLKAPRCGGGDPASGLFVQGGPSGLFGDDIRGGLPPLTAEETTPEKPLEGQPASSRYWQSEPAQRVFKECMKLRRAPDGSNYSEAARKTPEWARQFSDVLNSMAGWKASDEKSDADYFHQKAIVYQALLELAPRGDAVERTIASFVDFLRNSTLAERSPVEWFWHARSTLERVRADQPERAAAIAAAYRSSGSIVLLLELKLNEVAPTNPFAPRTAP